MSDEDLNEILDENEAVTEAAVEDPVAETEEAKLAEPEAKEEPKAEAPMVPLAAMTEERVKRQMLEQQLAQYTQKPPEPQPLPDVLAQPNEFAQSIQQQVTQATENARLDISEAMARQAHGDAVVNDALEAAKQAGVVGQFANKQHAWGELVKWKQQQDAMAEIGDPSTYKERIAAEVRKEIQAQMAAEQIKAAPSLAGETSVGGRSQTPAPTLTPIDDILG